MTLTRQSDNLIIRINGSDDSLTVQSYFNTDGASSYVVENLKFADGTVWNLAALQDAMSLGTEANDNLRGSSGKGPPKARRHGAQPQCRAG